VTGEKNMFSLEKMVLQKRSKVEEKKLCPVGIKADEIFE